MRPLSAPAALTAILFATSAVAIPMDCTTSHPGAPAFAVELVSPDPTTTTFQCQAQIVGSVSLAAPPAYDIYIVLDISGSTAGASGLDLDGDGIVGEGDWRTNTDPDDSTLHAEIESIRRALAAWEGSDVRVALIEFSAVIPIPPGLPEEQGRITTVQGLTADLNLVRAGLDAVLATGPAGATDYGGALFELAAEFDRSGDPTRQPVAFFLSDGKPTFPRYPYDATELLDLEWMREGAQAVADRDLPTNTLEIGVFDDVGALAEVAEKTGGRFVPHLEREAILDALTSIDLDGFANAELLNQTSGDSEPATLDTDGGFDGSIRLRDGVNDLSFTATLTTPEGDWGIACEVTLIAECEGCTYTLGWWKTHHRYARNPSQQVPWPVDEDTLLCGQTYLDILTTSPRGDYWYNLAHQWISTMLNAANAATVPPEVQAALDAGLDLLDDCTIADPAAAQGMTALLDAYNNGLVGPVHCGDGTTTTGSGSGDILGNAYGHDHQPPTGLPWSPPDGSNGLHRGWIRRVR